MIDNIKLYLRNIISTQPGFVYQMRYALWALVEYLIILEQLSAVDIHCPLSIDDGQFHNFEPAAWSGVYHGESHEVDLRAILTFKSVWTTEVDT